MGWNSYGHHIEMLPILQRLWNSKYFHVVYTHFSDEKWYAIEIEDMKDIWYPLIYIGNGLKFKSQDSVGPEPKYVEKLW